MTVANDSSWIPDAKLWIEKTFATQNRPITGAIEVLHSRPWSCIMTIPSGENNFYFKATDGLSAHEVPLSTYLSEIMPEHSPKLIAVHPQKAWMIMADAGQRMRESLLAQLDWKHWETALPQYAKIQQKLAENPEKLASFGMPNRSLANFGQIFDTILAETELYRIDEEGGTSSKDFERLSALKPIIIEKAQALAAYPIPTSIHHGDLHDGNIFHNGDTYSFYDWGDACMSHPFVSLRTSYVSAEIRFGLDENAPELQRLRNAYLAAWRDFASKDDLLAAFTLTEELWAIPTAHNWHAQILKEEDRSELAHIMPSLAEEILASVKL